MFVVVITRWLMVIKLEKEKAFLIQPRDGRITLYFLESLHFQQRNLVNPKVLLLHETMSINYSKYFWMVKTSKGLTVQYSNSIASNKLNLYLCTWLSFQTFRLGVRVSKHILLLFFLVDRKLLSLKNIDNLVDIHKA